MPYGADRPSGSIGTTGGAGGTSRRLSAKAAETQPVSSPEGTVPVTEIEHCWIAMRDGVRLSARLWLPEMPDGAPTPAILEYIPYRKRDMVRARDERKHPVFARHGYACLRVDMRGTGQSEGLMADMYLDDERDDAVDVIDWIARQSWCDGAVGMFGTSWGGTASLQAAARRPDALKAIIAVCATNDRFNDDIHYMGGAVLADSVEWGATLPAILASPPDPEIAGPGWRELWQARLDDLAFPLESWLRHQTRDAYWRRGSVCDEPGAITCPVLAIGGWADRYSNTVMNLLAGGHDQCWGVIGPWGHHYPDKGHPGPGISSQQLALRWWDRWLKGVDNGMDREPRLTAWCQDYQTPRDLIDLRAGHWISEPQWPAASVMEQRLHLNHGQLMPEPMPDAGSASVPLDLTVGMAAGDTGYFGRPGGLPLDQAPDDAVSLIFETEPLAEPVEILGAAKLRLMVDMKTPEGQIAIRLNDVPPGGEVHRVTYAVRNLALDEAGQAVDMNAAGHRYVEITLANTAYRFAAGHRIRLSISASYWPIVFPSSRQSRVTLVVSDSTMTLPVRQATEPDRPTEFGAASALIDEARHRVVDAPPLERWNEQIADGAILKSGWRQPLLVTHHPEIGLDFGFENSADYSISPDDPSSASVTFSHRLVYRRQGWEVDIHSKVTVSVTQNGFSIDGWLDALENGARVKHKTWQNQVLNTPS